jgi:hypothetical protein
MYVDKGCSQVATMAQSSDRNGTTNILCLGVKKGEVWSGKVTIISHNICTFFQLCVLGHVDATKGDH